MFHLKRALMQKILDQRKRRDPFDYEKAEAFTLGTDGDGTMNNSYYFSAHSKEKEQSLYTRLGIKDNGMAEVWVFFSEGLKYYYLEQLIFKLEDSPLKVEKDGEIYKFSFEGELISNEGEKIKAKLNCEYSSSKPAIDFYMHMPSLRVATAMAQERWSKNLFEEVQKNNSTHYEQDGILSGSLILGEKNIEIDLPCLRDHAFGRRVWGYMNNHLWLAGIDKECLFNFSMVSYPAMSVLEVGHIRQQTLPVEFVTKAFYDRNIIVTGEVPKEITLSLETTSKRTVVVHANLLHYVAYPFENGDYTLYEGIADLEVDGIKTRGILEIGFNKDGTRFMNGKKIDKIRE